MLFRFSSKNMRFTYDIENAIDRLKNYFWGGLIILVAPHLDQ